MGEEGRVLVRASGTEPLLRIMVEAADSQVVEHWTSKLAALAKKYLTLD
jgi:phosphoglucosamine mutase